MKKLIALVLIMCMLLPMAIIARAQTTPQIYIFGDEWAAAWGKELTGFSYDPATVINAAGTGYMLSAINKKAEYALVGQGDVVILSYGILEKDRPGDNNGEFKKNLEKTVTELQKKGATVIFASICSTMRYNTVTGQMAETKNFYTETTRTYAKENNITYIDLANISAAWANRLGSANSSRLYNGALNLTDRGNVMCAYEVFKVLSNIDGLKGIIKNNLSQVYTVAPGTYSKDFDVFFEEDICDYFTVFIKSGSNVRVNTVSVPDGDVSYTCQSIGGKINISFSSCEKIQVTPLYRFEASGFSTTAAPFEGSILPGEYDVTVRKTEPLRASVYLNSYLIASNLDMPGTEPVTEAAEHTYNEYHIDNGKFSVTVTGLTDKLEYISFRESASIYDQMPRIFVGGDSTLCNYYPLQRTGQEEYGTVMTGWAMLLGEHVQADVVNLAASGDWATKWLSESFPIVEKEGRAGDIFIVQFGINDLYKSTIPEMKAALSEMIDRTAQKGIIPILVSPQISAGYGWGDTSNVGKSDGGAYEEVFSAVRELAAEKGCFYVDLTDLSSGWFSEIGRDEVYKRYHIWDYEKNQPGDMMHLSYRGADAVCHFFMLGIQRIQESNQTDKWGNSLNSLKIW